MRILITTVQVPFVRGGAEAHAAGLEHAFKQAGHDAEIVQLPFKWYPPSAIPKQILAARLFDVTASSGVPVDLVVGLRFPAYFVPHPNKVVWVLHQHRTAYDLWGSELCDLMHAPDGRDIRDAIRAADEAFLPEAKALFANSKNVADRLQRFSGLSSTPLYHPPPGADKLYSAPAEDFLFLPSRINRTKRQHLILEALALCKEPVKVWFTGAADDSRYEQELQDRTVALGLSDAARFMGSVDEATKLDLYARCLGVVYVPVDEDYGYVTLEAMLARKPVITCADSGGALEFVLHDQTGMVTPPDAQALANAMDRLWQDRTLASRWGAAARQHYSEQKISWDNVVQVLTHAS